MTFWPLPEIIVAGHSSAYGALTIILWAKGGMNPSRKAYSIACHSKNPESQQRFKYLSLADLAVHH